MPFEHALLSLDDGRRLRAAANQPMAVARLEEAHRLFSDLESDPYVRACAAELAALEALTGPVRRARGADARWSTIGAITHTGRVKSIMGVSPGSPKTRPGALTLASTEATSGSPLASSARVQAAAYGCADT